MGSGSLDVHGNVHGGRTEPCAIFKQADHYSNASPSVLNPNLSAVKSGSSTVGTKVVLCSVKSDKVVKGGQMVAV